MVEHPAREEVQRETRDKEEEKQNGAEDKNTGDESMVKSKDIRRSPTVLLGSLFIYTPTNSAAGQGFEPRLLGPEPSVLPLDDPAPFRHSQYHMPL